MVQSMEGVSRFVMMQLGTVLAEQDFHNQVGTIFSVNSFPLFYIIGDRSQLGVWGRMLHNGDIMF